MQYQGYTILTLTRRCRHVSQAREVYFLPGRLRLAVSSVGARDIEKEQYAK
jgi:hypothetical protein